MNDDHFRATLFDVFTSPNEVDSNLETPNLVDGLFSIARGLNSVAKAVDRLGNANADTPMGGMEALGKTIGDSLDRCADAIEGVPADLNMDRNADGRLTVG